MTKHRTPSHPGGILKRLYLEPLKLTIVDLAGALGVSRKSVSKLVNERGSVTPEMAMRLSIALQTTPQLWMNLQRNFDLWCVRDAGRGVRSVRAAA